MAGTLIICLVLGAALHSTRGQQTQTKTVCETTGPEDLTCTIGTELYIVDVLYGRTGALPVTTCNPYNKQGMNMNCKQQTTQALDHVKQLCNAKSKCTVTNDYNVLGDPCPGDPKFLKVDYQCIIPTTPPPTTPTVAVNSTVGGTAVTSAASGPVVTSTTPVTTTTAATASTYKTTTMAPNNSQETICEMKDHTFSCPTGQVLYITHVLWGRLPPAPSTLCNPYNTSVVGANCKSGPAALQYVQGLCEGKPTCLVMNDWQQLGADPCVGIPKYLQVTYMCAVPTTTTLTTQPMNSTTTVSTTPTTTASTTPTTTVQKTTTVQTTTTPTTPQPTTPTTTPQVTQPNLPPGINMTTICSPNTDRIKCNPGDEIIIDDVFYGRRSQYYCNTNNTAFPNLPCVGGAGAGNQVRLYCDHQSQCIVEARLSWLNIPDPCPAVTKYLQIKFHCQPLGTPPTTTSTTTSTTTTTPTTTTITTTPTTTTSTTTPTTTVTTTTPTTTTSTTTRTTTSTTTPTTTSTTTPTTTSTTTPTTTTSTTTPTTTTSTTTATTTATTTPTTTSTTTPTTTSTTTQPTTITTTTAPTTTLPPFIPFTPPANIPAGAQACHEYLISGPHGVPDSHLTASSSWNSGLPQDNNGPDRSRLFTQAYDYGNGTFYRGAWTAGQNDQNQYIQVELLRPSLIRGVVTQGRHVDPLTLCCVQRTTSYKVSYSNDGKTWTFIQDSNKNDLIFTGNSDDDSLVKNMLDCNIMARFVRIHPQSWYNHVALRFDLIGCQAITTDIGKCDPGWKELPGTDHCYFFAANATGSWTEARAACLRLQGHLVDITSVPEKDFILQEISHLPPDMWWVGLTNTPRQDTKDYKWTDGTAHDDTILPWKKGQPDNGGYGEHCGEFWNRELNDDNCDNKRNYICEKDKYWTIPVNTPPVVMKTNPTPPTIASTPSTSPATQGSTTTMAPPPTIFIPIATRPGVGYVSNSRNIFSTGCMSSMADCASKPEGDYPNCAGCSVYATCAVSGFYTRPCPQYLKWDDNVKSCQFRSSTCFGP